MAEPRDVGVDDHARGHAESRAQHDVGRFPTDARQLDQRSRSCGTWPPCSSTSLRQQAWMFLALLRKKPVL